MIPLYTLDRRLSGPQNQSIWCGEERILYPVVGGEIVITAQLLFKYWYLYD
jgi:hypothetical protein